MARTILAFLFLLTPPALRADTFQDALSGVVDKVRQARDDARYRWRWYPTPPHNVCVNAFGERGYNAVSIEELLKTNDGECVDFRGRDLSGLFLPGVNLQGSNLNDVGFKNSVLRKGRLRGSTLTDTDFSGADLRVADISKLDMRGSTVAGADLSGALIYRTDMRGVDARGANFQGADIYRTDLREAEVEGARFVHARYNGLTLLPFSEERAAELGMVRVE